MTRGNMLHSMDLNADQSLTEATDEQLVTFYRSGRDEAFEALLDRYRQELFHFLMRFTGSRAAAEDVFQEAFLQIHLSIDTFRTNLRFRPWLFTIAANKARDYLRRSNRRPFTSLSSSAKSDEAEERSVLDLMQADLALPQEEAVRAETRQLVRDTVASLPEHLREILALAYFQQVPYKEIAEALKIPLGTVKSRLHTAVGTFAQRWKEGMDAAGESDAG